MSAAFIMINVLFEYVLTCNTDRIPAIKHYRF
jgi:hypothetical protein